MIGWEYPPNNSGGLGVACKGMTQALAVANNQIYFTLPYNCPHCVSHMTILSCFDPAWKETNKAPFNAYSSARKALDKKLDASQLRALPESELEQKVDAYAKLVAQKARKLGHDFDVIHAHDWMSFPAAMQVKKASGKPMVTHVHSTEWDRIPTGYGSHYISNIEHQGMQAADKVIAVSYYTKRLLVDKYNINPNKIEVVYNGINPLKVPVIKNKDFAKKRPVVVFMGRMTMQKGVEFVIGVAKKVLEKLPNCLFVLAGSGDIYQELLFSTAGNGLSASVLFSGFVRDKQRDKLLDRADLFMMPSVSEPFGLVALEAAQRNTPVIISTNSGVSEVMKTSVAIDFWDVNKMSEEVVKILTNKGYGDKIVKGQLEDLSNTSWNRSARGISSVYRKAFLGG